jgi:hypothetical protein
VYRSNHQSKIEHVGRVEQLVDTNKRVICNMYIMKNLTQSYDSSFLLPVLSSSRSWNSHSSDFDSWIMSSDSPPFRGHFHSLRCF